VENKRISMSFLTFFERRFFVAANHLLLLFLSNVVHFGSLVLLNEKKRKKLENPNFDVTRFFEGIFSFPKCSTKFFSQKKTKQVNTCMKQGRFSPINFSWQLSLILLDRRMLSPVL
jgi:hypothetical protein